ncbi:MAG: hypothetical protein ACW986_16610 [Promethearchaeota archaeon]|jgi:hypothetical protein
MVQVLDKKKELDEIIIIEIEELPATEEIHKVVELKTERKPIKKALLKLFRKAKYNAKYLEELTPVNDVKSNIESRPPRYFRSY